MNSNSGELEKSLLGLILENNKAWDKVRFYLTVQDFENKNNQIIFQTMLSMFDEGYEVIDLESLIKVLIKNNQLEKIGGFVYLNELISNAAFLSNLEAIVKSISLLSRKKRVKDILESSLKSISSTSKNIEDEIEKIEKNILSATRDETVKDFQTINEVSKMAQLKLNQKLEGFITTGLLTNFEELDNKLGGLQPGNLVILAARPGQGKTTFAINISTNISRKKKIGFFSLEMSAIEIINRIVSSISLVPGEKIKNPQKLSPKEINIVNNKYLEVGKMNFFIDDSATIRLSDLIWKAKKIHKAQKLDLLVIDYLQLLSISTRKNESRQQEVSIISRSLKQLARELQIPIIALSQLSRKIEQRPDKKPLLSDLRESGSIEQDADIILFINKEQIDEEEFKDNFGQVPVDIIVAKHRSGSTGKITLSFKADILTFFSGGQN